MKKFWSKSSSNSSSAATRNGSSFSSLNNGNSTPRLPSITKSSPNISSSSLPTRKQRMQLLKSILHHADKVQNSYLVPKDLSDPNAPKPQASMLDMSSLLYSSDTVTNEINEKCYQRWHQVLQEGLVPMSVRALNLLQKSAANNLGDIEDEEDKYFATMEGMEEEIQVMAILARAAALNDDTTVPTTTANNEESDDTKQNNTTAKTDPERDGMEQINAMMKCTTMLLFHIVLDASSSTSSSEKNDFKTVAGYDGRVRSVTKSACVDVLSRAIIDSVECYEREIDNNVDDDMDTNDELVDETATQFTPPNSDREEDGDSVYDLDEYSVWNIPNIKAFLDQNDLGKDAIFGTLYHRLGKEKEEKKKLLTQESNEPGSVTTSWDNSRHSQSQEEEDENNSKQSQSQGDEKEDDDKSTVSGEGASIEGIDSMNTFSTSSFEVQSEEVIVTPGNNGCDNDSNSSNYNSKNEEDEEDGEHDLEQELDNLEQELDTPVEEDESQQSDHKSIEEEGTDKDMEEPQNTMTEVEARRLSNAKYLATRKFELIERLVAIDIVRFLMAEEREIKLLQHEMKAREQELEQQKKNNSVKLPSFLRQDVEENDMDENDDNENDNTANLDDSALEEKMNDALDEDGVNKSFFTASRVKQMKRSAKIAGMGLALGTVFAITGGLAAPALAAGIGGIAALTGATTASSTALLAVLATFKAGAALFGVGGGGLAAYKMKKRTAGLSNFEVRRENIEQYMFMGASDEQMKKGIETMLPQLHTTVAVTGWLRDNDVADFQLAWGIQPTCEYEKVEDKRKIRQMKRFYSVYNPPLVHLCGHFMETLKKRLKSDFSWDRIWLQLEEKYGFNPDHMMPLDTAHENEVYLSYEEKEMIETLLNDAKIFNLRKRGFEVEEEMDFDESDDIGQLLQNMSPKKGHRKKHTADSQTDLALDMDTIENELVKSMENDLALNGSETNNLTESDSAQANESDDEGEKPSVDAVPQSGSPSLKERMARQREEQATFLRENGLVYDKSNLEEEEEDEENNEVTETYLSVHIPNGDADNDDGAAEEVSPSLQERMSNQRAQQVSFLKSKGLIDDASKLQEGAGSPTMVASSTDENDAQDPPVKNEEQVEEFDEEDRCPIVWDWKRMYGTADIHTVTWESKMLSSLCHIVENMALEVSSQATKVALQYSVIGAIISAVAIPSALITASKLIDDPYQIVVIRADEAGKELAKCLLQSDERRPVTLVGFSFGARVIYSCLRELARQQDIWEENRKPKPSNAISPRSSFLKKKSKDEQRFEYDREPASLVADVIFIGLPRAIDKKILTSCRRVTGGRLVNCYTRNDWLLSLMFVARGGTPCGTKPIKDVPGVENFDVTNFVETHSKYADAIPSILQHVRFTEPEP